MTTAGNGYCWGGNDFGEIGDGSTTARPAPTESTGGHNWASITGIYQHTCGVTMAGDAYCWGSNRTGELGNGTQSEGNPNSVPIQVTAP